MQITLKHCLQFLQGENLSSVATTWRKWIVRGLWLLVGLYILLCTFVWQIVFSLFLFAATPSEMTIGELEKTALCRSGDWVLDTFQPMVSDARLIKHLHAHREEMERIEQWINGQHFNKRGIDYVELKKLIEPIEIERAGPGMPWPNDPYAIEIPQEVKRCLVGKNDVADRYACFKDRQSVIAFTPSFGRNDVRYFCNGRGTTGKNLVYFPGVPPRIENGFLLGPINAAGVIKPHGKLVSSTDRNPNYENIARQIDAHWFISRSR